ncbi:MAG: helix-turn-helix transcriptional regulator [Verrucomicrobia bacterium]|nr:helix-turn-helix transcriptional regulator [Verrucomicrobiota bacterium]
MDTLAGARLNLPMVMEVGATRTHEARCVSWHAHPGCQLIFLLRGTTTCEFRRRSRTELELAGGHFLIIPPGLAHRSTSDMRPPCILLHIVLGQRARSDCQNTSFTPEEWRWIRKRFARASLSVHPFSAELQRLAEKLVRAVPEFCAHHEGGLPRARLRAGVCEILLETAAQLNVSTKAVPDDMVEAAKAYLRRRLDEKLLISNVARALGVGRARLFEQFKRSAGMTPNDFLIRARVEKARELMTNQRMSVTEIAYAVGFCSSQYFSTVFRRHTGLTPGEYRVGKRTGGRVSR